MVLNGERPSDGLIRGSWRHQLCRPAVGGKRKEGGWNEQGGGPAYSTGDRRSSQCGQNGKKVLLGSPRYLVPGTKPRGGGGPEEELGGGRGGEHVNSGLAGAHVLLPAKVGLQLGAQAGQETQRGNILLEKTTQPCRRVLPLVHASSLA